MKIGAHQSIAGGLQLAPQRAASIGLECFQMFTKAPQNWQEPELTSRQISLFQNTCRQCGFESGQIAVHASYLVNPCSAVESTRKKAVAALVNEAMRCDSLQIAYLVFHPGSPGKQGEDMGIALVADAVQNALAVTRDVTLLIENTAGSGKSIGHRFEHIAAIVALVGNDNRIGCCFDTAHAFAAGYDISTVSGASSVFGAFDDAVGLERLKWMHLNDSRTGLGSRVDRHEKIGEGRIGETFFQWLVNASFATRINCTLETPINKNETYEAAVSALKALRNQ
ncbi:MAG: deoxyribonuclease IV [Deltaproteobacteria bacterium]|nr:deoxyribonuclease IV [Deltaproteobacteria bacterium]